MARKKSKKKEVNFRLGFLIGGVGGLIGICLFFMALYFIYISMIDLGQGPVYSFLRGQERKAYENVVGYWQESEFVESLSYICSLQKSELERIKCVYSHVNNTFNYTHHGLGNQLRRSPEDLIELGGVCRDFSVMYCSIYEKMGLDCDFISLPRHVYVNVTCEDCDFYCWVDMNKIGCIEKDEN